MAKAPLTRTNTVKSFVKDLVKDDIRIGDDTVDHVIKKLTALATITVKKAARLAEADDRTTILDEDLDTAYDHALRQTVPGLTSPNAIFQSIDAVPNDTLIELIKLVNANIP